MSLDLNKLSNKLDAALINETTETLTKFLNDKRMTNNKQQTAVEDLETQIEKLRFQGVTEWQCGYQKALNEVLFLLKQAKEMEKKQHEITYNQSLMSNFQTFNDYYDSTYGGNK